MKRNITLTRQEDKWLGEVHQCAGWIARCDGIAAWGPSRQSAYGRVWRELQRRDQEAQQKVTERAMDARIAELLSDFDISEEPPQDNALEHVFRNGGFDCYNSLLRSLDAWSALYIQMRDMTPKFSAVELTLIGDLCHDWRYGRTTVDWRAVDELGRKLGVWK